MIAATHVLNARIDARGRSATEVIAVTTPRFS
jgi:hypothetical protein